MEINLALASLGLTNLLCYSDFPSINTPLFHIKLYAQLKKDATRTRYPNKQTAPGFSLRLVSQKLPFFMLLPSLSHPLFWIYVHKFEAKIRSFSNTAKLFLLKKILIWGYLFSALLFSLPSCFFCVALIFDKRRYNLEVFLLHRSLMTLRGQTCQECPTCKNRFFFAAQAQNEFRH